MVFLSPINLVMLFVVTAFKAKMIANEERLLRQDPEYQEYAARVRWRALPGSSSVVEPNSLLRL